ncbi:FIST N domain protein [Moorella thermoacetica]|uniref:FIST N domain protein n=1 Tax=Neomoorella thermoacetica TaxID=1525 RepID=A0A1J5JZF7_NEOTH|nr:FIST N domain protein [Moorella thermoacetica]
MVVVIKMRVGVGFSSANDPSAAGQVASEQAVRQSGSSVITLVLTTDNYDQERVLSAVKRVIGNSRLVGACVPGVIVNARLYKRGVGICTVSGEGVEAVTHLQRNISQHSYRKGEKAGEALLEKGGETPGTVLLFPDGFAANISGLLRGLYNVMGPSFEYIGGGSGDNLRFYRTYQFTEEGISSDAVAAAVIRGINFQMCLSHGWRPVGEPLMVTKAKGRKVYEIDGLPALERYSALVGAYDKNDFSCYSMKYPLGLPCAGGEFIIRDPLKAEEDGGILFVTEIPENTIATLMEGDTASLLAAAEEVSKKALNTPAAPKTFMVFDCVSRYLLMREDFSREMEAIARSIKAEIPVIGMLSFGEISSISGTPLFYNKTIVAAAGW